MKDAFVDAWNEMIAEVQGFAVDGAEWFSELSDAEQLLSGAGGMAFLLFLLKPKKVRGFGAIGVGTLLMAVTTMLALTLGIAWIVESVASDSGKLVG